MATSSIIILFMLDNYVHCAFNKKSENNFKQTVFSLKGVWFLSWWKFVVNNGVGKGAEGGRRDTPLFTTGGVKNKRKTHIRGLRGGGLLWHSERESGP